MKMNLTHGNILKNVIVFSLPFLLSYFLQTLYGMADLFIVGQYNGSDIISAVSIASQVMHMITVVIVGLAMGASVLIGRAVGAKDDKNIARIIGNTIFIFVIVAAAFVTLLLLFCPSIISIMSTPKEAVEQTRIYLLVCFSGIPFIIAYNVISSVFRGLGDSKSPMIFVAVACVINIILDYVFIGLLGLQAFGAALATILSQFSSVIFSLIACKLLHLGVKVSLKDIKPHFESLKSILAIGVPVACQDGFIQISFLVITIIANRRGVDVAAAVGIVEKIISFLFLVPSTMLSTISAIAAQNMGAGYHERARKTLYCGITIACTFGLIVSFIFQFAASPILSLFTSDKTVITLGVQYIRSYVIDCIFAGIHFCFSGYFCAYGVSIVSFIHNVASIILLRVPGAYFASKYFPDTLFPMGVAAPAGSLLSAFICLAFYLYMRGKQKKIE